MLGTTRIVDDSGEKSAAADRMIDGFYPELSVTLRPSTELCMKTTTIIGMKIEQASGQIPAKDVGDEEAGYAPPI